MKRIYILFVVLLFLLGANFVFAAGEIVISPSIIDEKAKAREIFDYNVKLKNTTDKKYEIFVFTQDVGINDAKTEIISPSSVERSSSLSRWITIKRIIKLDPQEELVLPMRIAVDMDAIPGKYYNVLTFSPGSNRDIARKNLDKSQAQIIINIDVQDEIIERAQISYFKPVKNLNFQYPVDLVVGIKNSGNVDIVPSGNVFIYDRKNRQVGMLEVNSNLDSAQVDSASEYVVSWRDFKGFGKMKAKIELEYGGKYKRDLQDTIFFWVLPWSYLLIFCVAFIFLLLLITLVNKRSHQEKPKSNRPNVDGIINLKDK